MDPLIRGEAVSLRPDPTPHSHSLPLGLVVRFTMYRLLVTAYSRCSSKKKSRVRLYPMIDVNATPAHYAEESADAR